MKKYVIVCFVMQSLLASSSGRRKFNLSITSQQSELCLDGQTDLELRCVLTTVSTSRLQEDGEQMQLQQSAHYVWFHNASLVIASHDSYTVQEKLVIVTDANQATAVGAYECIATIPNVGSLISPAVRVRAADIRISEMNDNSSVRVKVGNTALIRCPKVIAFPSAPLFSFLVNGTNQITKDNGSRFFITATGMQVAATTLADSGTYQCIVENRATHEKVYGRPVKLTVENDTRFSEAIKVIYPIVKQSNVETPVGSNVTFECIFNGVVPPATTWEKYGGELSPERHTVVLGNLLMNNVSKDDQGSYICRAGMPPTAGKALLDVSMPFIIFALSVTDPLKVRLSYSITNKRDGQRLLELTCETFGSHSPMLFWYFNSKPLLKEGNNVLGNDFTGGQNSRWVITLASDLPAGIYECVAVSGDLSASDSVFIATSRVTGADSSSVLFDQAEDLPSARGRGGSKLPEIVTGPRNFTAYADTSFIFLCQTVNADRIIWLKNNLTVLDQERFSIIGTGSLKIDPIRTDDQGRYTCKASNAFGSVSKSAWLKVETPVVPVVSDSARGYGVSGGGQRLAGGGGRRDGSESWLTSSGGDSRAAGMTTQHPKVHLKHRHVPFDAPQVFQVSNTSVLLKWRLPQVEDLPGNPHLFKIQYKKLKSGEDWQTVDINLPHYSASHVVDHLVPGNYYRFRVAVIYDNYMQSTSKASVKFTLAKMTAVKPPSVTPSALKAVSKWPDAIKVEWQYPSEEMANIDGFVIRFRRIYSGAGVAYENETIPGATTREHMLDHLLPATPYEIKVVAYNGAGQTRSSNTVVTNTLNSDGSENSLNFLTTTLPASRNTSLLLSPSQLSLDSETLLFMLGGIVGFLVIVLVAFLVVCGFRHKRKSQGAKKTFSEPCPPVRREHSSLLDKSSDEVKFRASPSPTGIGSKCGKNGRVNLYSNPGEERSDFASVNPHSNFDSRTLKQICAGGGQPTSVSDSHPKGFVCSHQLNSSSLIDSFSPRLNFPMDSPPSGVMSYHNVESGPAAQMFMLNTLSPLRCPQTDSSTTAAVNPCLTTSLTDGDVLRRQYLGLRGNLLNSGGAGDDNGLATDDAVPAMPLLESCDGVLPGNKQQFCTFKPPSHNHSGLLDLTSPLLFRNRLSDGYYSDSQ